MAENHVTLTLELPGDADDYVVSVRSRMPDDAVGRRGLRLFVSHASEDQEVAAQLVQSLEMFGVECFFSERSISSGTLWPAEIETQLNACDALLYLSSEHSNDSRRPPGRSVAACPCCRCRLTGPRCTAPSR